MQTNVKPGEVGPRGREGDQLTELELGAWRGFLAAHAAITRELDDELRDRHGLSLSAYEVLMLVGDAPAGRMRISELSARSLLSVSGASRLVDRLVRSGHLVKEPCEEDARGAQARLTPLGRGRLRAARASHLAGVRRRFLERFSDDELRGMAAYWERLAPEAGEA